MTAHAKFTHTTAGDASNRALVDEARELGIDVLQAPQHDLARLVREAKETAWLAENREAIASMNAYVEQHGLPLRDHRRF